MSDFSDRAAPGEHRRIRGFAGVAPFLTLTLLLSLVLMPRVDATENITVPPIRDDIEGISSSSLAKVAQEPQAPWVIVKITPAPRSGIPMASVVIGQPPKPLIVTCAAFGSYAVVDQLGSPVTRKEAEYRWDLPQIGISREDRQLMDASRPFTADDARQSWFLLCLLHETETGSKRFSNVHFVPDEWRAALSPAVMYFRSHSSLLNADLAKGDHSNAARDALESLTCNSNPYLVLTSYQLLAKIGGLTQEGMARALALSDTRLIASVVSMVSAEGWLEPSINGAWLESQVNTAKTLDLLEGITLGVECGQIVRYGLDTYTDDSDVAPPSYQERAFEPRLMRAIRAKLLELYKPPSDRDERAHVIDEVLQGVEQ